MYVWMMDVISGLKRCVIGTHFKRGNTNNSGPYDEKKLYEKKNKLLFLCHDKQREKKLKQIYTQ